MLTVCHRTKFFGATLYNFEDDEFVIKMIIKGRSTTMRHVSRTHRVALHWLFDRINLDSKIQIKYVDTNTNSQTSWQKGISHVMSETIFFICLTSAILVHSAALRISAWPAAPKRWRKGCKNRKERTGSWQSQSRRRWTWPSLSRQVLRLCRIRLRRKAQGYSRHPFEKIGYVQGNLTQKNTQSRRSVEFSKMAQRCSSGSSYEETRRDRRRPGTPELSWRFSKYEETRRFRKLRNRRLWQSLAT